MKFSCPTCEQVRHVNDDHRDPRCDACWYCGTLVPVTDAELKRYGEEIDPAYGKPLTQDERERYEREARAESELGCTKEEGRGS